MYGRDVLLRVMVTCLIQIYGAVGMFVINLLVLFFPVVVFPSSDARRSGLDGVNGTAYYSDHAFIYPAICSLFTTQKVLRVSRSCSFIPLTFQVVESLR